MKTPVLIVVIASVVVLCTLPALYIFLAYHTLKEREKWKADYDKQVNKIEVEEQGKPRPASTATSHNICSSPAAGRAPSAQNNYYHHQSRSPARPAPAHAHSSPRAAPPRPPREVAERGAVRPMPSPRRTTRNGGPRRGSTSSQTLTNQIVFF